MPDARSFAVLVMLSLAVVLPQKSSAQTGDAGPENVVFIFSDDHRYDYMGFHENAPDFLETPSLDRMRQGGVHIANAFVGTSLCSPSRGAGSING